MKRFLLSATILFILAGCSNSLLKNNPTDNSSLALSKSQDNMKTEMGLSAPVALSLSKQGFEAGEGKVNFNKYLISSVKTKSKKVSLTFDDGPDNKYTPMILDILKKNHIQATFFVIGEHAQKYPQIIQRIEQEGHSIGNHSWDHANLAKLPNDKVQSEINQTDALIKSETGQATTIFRAPYGALSQDVVQDAISTGHQIIGWSVDTLDWEGKSSAQILYAVKKEVKPGAIILQHSAGGKGGNLSNTVQALPQIITYLQSNGYSFVPLSELLSS